MNLDIPANMPRKIAVCNATRKRELRNAAAAQKKKTEINKWTGSCSVLLLVGRDH